MSGGLLQRAAAQVRAARSWPRTRRGAALARELRALPADKRLDVLLELVTDKTKLVLGLAPEESIATDATFADLGLNSARVVELGNNLARATGIELSTTATFDCPTPERLSAHLLEQLVGPPAPAARPEPDRTSLGTEGGRDIESASADELMSMLDDELSSSG